MKMESEDNELEFVKVESDSDFLKLPSVNNLEAETAEVTSLHSLPEVSRKKYEAAYKSFMDWHWSNEQKPSYSESVLIAYFDEISSKYKSSTLWTQYSMLKTLLNTHHNVNIASYSKLKSFLKQQSDGYQARKSKAFTSNEINKFIKEAPDEDYLLTKVALIMGAMGACRKHELHRMKVSDFNDLGSTVLVTVPDTKANRKFTISGPWYDIYKKYAILRPPNVNDSYFFLNYQKGKCLYQKVGINKLGAMGKQIAKYLKLPNPETYTGHCFRRSSATIPMDVARDQVLFRHNEIPQSSKVVESSKSVRTETVNTIGSSVAKTEYPSSSSSDNSINLTYEVQQNFNHLPNFTFTNCNNITINFVNK